MKNKKKILNIIIYTLFSILIIYIFSFKYKNNTEGYTDIKIQGILLILALIIGGFILLKKNISKRTKVFLILLAITLYVSYPLYNDYLPWSHDISFHQMRIENVADAIKKSQIPTRIYQLRYNGFGYGVSMLYPEVFIYIPAILRVMNVSAVFSYKIFLIFINFMSVLSMYLCVKNISKSTKSGIIGAILYASANYRLEDVFARGAIGEALALAFFPLLIWGLYEICCGDKKKWYLVVIGMTCILQSHIISVFFAVIVCAIFAIFYFKRIVEEKRHNEILISIVITILLNLWFIVPFFQAYNLDLNVKSLDYDNSFWDNAVMPTQLFNIFDKASGLRISNVLSYGMNNEMNFSLGLLSGIGIIISIIYCYKNRDKKEDLTKFLKILTGMSIVFLICSTTIFPWKELMQRFNVLRNFADALQFSWRFLVIPTFGFIITSSIIIGKYIISKYKTDKEWIDNNKIILLITLIAFITVPMFLEEYTKQPKAIVKGSEDQLGDMNSSWEYYGEYLIKGTQTSEFKEYKCKTSNSLILTNIEKSGTKTIINYQNHVGEGYIDVPLLYYPVYTARDENGNKLKIEYGENNCIRIKLNELNNGQIIIDCKDEGIYLLFDIISLITLIGFILYIVFRKKNVKIIENEDNKIESENIEENLE